MLWVIVIAIFVADTHELIRFHRRSCTVGLVAEISTFSSVNSVLPFSFTASLSSSLSDDLLAKATVEVVRLLSNKSLKSEMIRTNIQMIGALR